MLGSIHQPIPSISANLSWQYQIWLFGQKKLLLCIMMHNRNIISDSCRSFAGLCLGLVLIQEVTADTDIVFIPLGDALVSVDCSAADMVGTWTLDATLVPSGTLVDVTVQLNTLGISTVKDPGGSTNPIVWNINNDVFSFYDTVFDTAYTAKVATPCNSVINGTIINAGGTLAKFAGSKI